jgi:hypothetical protein
VKDDGQLSGDADARFLEADPFWQAASPRLSGSRMPLFWSALSLLRKRPVTAVAR